MPSKRIIVIVNVLNNMHMLPVDKQLTETRGPRNKQASVSTYALPETGHIVRCPICSIHISKSKTMTKS